MAFIPAYMRVRQYCVDLALRHTDTQTRIQSERELCKRLGISRTTARKALKDLIDEGWLVVKPGKGMFVQSPGGRTQAGGNVQFFRTMVVWGDGKHVSLNGLYMDLLAGFCEVFKNLPILLQTANLVGTREQIVDEIAMYRPDAVIWVRPLPAHAAAIRKIRRTLPVCVVGNPPCGDPFHVTMDYEAAGRLAARWLLDRKIERAYYAGHEQGHGVMEAFLRGWMAAHDERGQPFDRSRIIPRDGDFIAATRRALEKGCDGIFCYGSEYAAVDRALEGAQAGGLPRVVDQTFFGTFGAQRAPDAQILFFRHETATLAAQQVFRRLTEPDFKPGETVVAPELQATTAPS